MTLLIFLLILSFLVLIHELGHMLVARFFGVKVDEFGIGYPPKAVSLFSRWGTEFTLNWLPFGGFVRLSGEERVEGEKAKPGLFYSARKWQRIAIIMAGAAVNFVFGVLAFSIVYSIVGIPTVKPGVAISMVADGSPAQIAGVVAGDVVIAVDKDGQSVKTENTNEFVDIVSDYSGSQVKLVLKGEKTVDIYVRKAEETPSGQGALGVSISDNVEMVHFANWQMPFRGAAYGLEAAITFGILIVTSLFTMVRDLIFSGVVPKDVAGPVGIVYQANQQGIFSQGLASTMHFAGVLSINLAIVNILPIPALDGGRALFILLEKIGGKKFKPVYENWANLIGFALLLTLIVMITVRDVGTILNDFGINFGSIAKMIGK